MRALGGRCSGCSKRALEARGSYDRLTVRVADACVGVQGGAFSKTPADFAAKSCVPLRRSRLVAWMACSVMVAVRRDGRWGVWGDWARRFVEYRPEGRGARLGIRGTLYATVVKQVGVPDSRSEVGAGEDRLYRGALGTVRGRKPGEVRRSDWQSVVLGGDGDWSRRAWRKREGRRE